MMSETKTEGLPPIVKSTIENVPNLVALVIAAVTAIVFATSPGAEHLNSALAALSAVLMLICLNQLLNAFLATTEQAAVRALTKRVAAVEQSMHNVDNRSVDILGTLQQTGRLVPCPETRPEVYVELFGGFAETFYAYNPAYTIEQSGDLSAAEKLLIKQVYVPRYEKTGHCLARYLFFTGDDNGQKSLARFRRLMQIVAKSDCGNVVHSVHVKGIDTPAAELDEIYFGKQHGIPVVVHDLSAPSESHGRPSFYYVSHSSELYNACVKRFDEAWYGSSAYDIHNPEKPDAFFHSAGARHSEVANT